MTLRIDPGAAPTLDLAGCIAELEAMRFEPRDEDAFIAAAPLLAGLAQDRAFLGYLMIAELGRRARVQERDNAYGAQVLMLHARPGWFMRANIWPAADDPLLLANGPRRFFYGVPHDHNFSFLTVGYLGPGYLSNYYERDDAPLTGAPGEPAGLRFVERAQLGEGEVMLYRAHRDVHDQHPPAATSISLNIVEGDRRRAFADQYQFDLERGTVAAQLAHTSSEALLGLLPALGGAEGADLLDHVARRHPCDRIRFGAIAAQAAAAGDLAGRIVVLDRAAAAPNRTVMALANARLAELERGRAWIERSPEATPPNRS